MYIVYLICNCNTYLCCVALFSTASYVNRTLNELLLEMHHKSSLDTSNMKSVLPQGKPHDATAVLFQFKICQ